MPTVEMFMNGKSQIKSQNVRFVNLSGISVAVPTQSVCVYKLEFDFFFKVDLFTCLFFNKA